MNVCGDILAQAFRRTECLVDGQNGAGLILMSRALDTYSENSIEELSIVKSSMCQQQPKSCLFIYHLQV